jgi:alpha-ketoglutarate-dependent taurine dioxygenase
MAQAIQYFATDTHPAKMLHHTITDERAWVREGISPTDWLVPFPEAGIAELDRAVQTFDGYPTLIQNLAVDMFPNLPVCRDVMTQVQTILRHQTGMAIIDRVPVERYSVEQNKAIYWLLGHMLGRVVDQKWGGTTLYDVKDAGKALGHGVRRSVTNLEQPFHTDGPWLSMTPEIIGLFCLQSAQTGGASRLVSLMTAHNQMRQHYPDLIERLYRPFVWDRQAEHHPSDVSYSTHPVFAYDGKQLTARYYDDYIRKGYVLAGDVLDAQGEEAMDAMQTIVNDPAHWVEFRIETGHIQYINNRQFAHARTKFADAQAASIQRHLIRCWYRDAGMPELEGRPTSPYQLSKQ